MKHNSLATAGLTLYYLHLFVSFVALAIVTPVLLNRLGAFTFGVWAQLSAAASYFALADLGLSTAMARYTAEWRATGRADLAQRMLAKVCRYYTITGGVIVLVTLFAAWWALASANPAWNRAGAAVAIVGATAMVGMIAGGVGNAIYGCDRLDLWKLGATANVVVSSGVCVVLLYTGVGIAAPASGLLAGSAVQLLFYVWVLPRASGNQIHFTILTCRDPLPAGVLGFSLRTLVLGLTSRVLYASDVLVIGAVLGSAAVTPYEVTYRLCFLATYSFSALSTAAVPHFAGLLAQGRNDELRRVVLITTRLSLTVVTPVVLFLWWAGGGVIELWAGKGAFAGDRVLAVLVVMTVLHAIGTPAGLLLQAIGRNKELVTSELANALLNLTLSIVLVQYVGTLGVALGTLIASTLTSTWVVPLVACKKIGLHPRQYIQEGLLRQVAVGMLAFAAMRTIFGATARPLSVATIALIGITSLVVTAVGTYGIGISAAERARLNGFVAVGGTSVSLRWQRSRNESARSKSDPF